MISEKMNESLNEQINKETFSAYLYLSMRAYFDNIGLTGFANWMYVQALEEFTHAERFYKYINSVGGRVKLNAIDAPDVEFKSPADAFEKTLTHERFITKSINELVNQAIVEKDHSSNNMLQWFVNEQVEEEEAPNLILQQLKLVGDNGHALLMLDRELGVRTFVPPVIV